MSLEDLTYSIEGGKKALQSIQLIVDRLDGVLNADLVSDLRRNLNQIADFLLPDAEEAADYLQDLEVEAKK